MLKLPFKLPAAYPYASTPGTIVTYVDTGGYDVLLDGHGFRLATDQQFPYERYTEPTTARRYDSSLEPGEQSLSALPWIKSQSSFHAGSGQQNAEQGFTAFQYDQEQIEHIRFDTCIGVDVWTPGIVKRLPDCSHYSLPITPTCVASATVNGVDYLIVGGAGLYKVAWNSGPDVAPTTTAIDLSAYGGNSNCNIASLASDGSNYYALINLTSPVSGSYIFIVSGRIGTTDTIPVTRYQTGTITDRGGRQNLCTNPSFKSGITNWVGIAGTTADSTIGHTDSFSLRYSSASFNNGVQTDVAAITIPASASTYYTLTLDYNIASMPLTGQFGIKADFENGSGTSLGSSYSGVSYVTGSWQTVGRTFLTPTGTTQIKFSVVVTDSSATGTYTFNIDDVLIEQGTDFLSYFDGDSVEAGFVFAWTGTSELSSSTMLPAVPPGGALGWAKSRLIGALGNKVYDLSSILSAVAMALPSPIYTHPLTSWAWRCVSESPRGVLVAGDNNGASPSSVLEMTLDTSTGTPTLLGGSTVATLPTGERVIAMQNILGTFIGLGTSKGIRVGTFDTYTGNFKYGPLTVETTQPVYALAGRDRFIYGSYTNQQANGSTGLVRVDLSMEVDTGGRLAWAPDLKPKSTDPLTGTVIGVDVLAEADRIVWVTASGVYVEGPSAGVDGDAWLQTSRIRFGTAEQKLFKLGRIHGDISAGVVQVAAIPSSTRVEQALATFAFQNTGTNDPDEFRLPNSLNEWIQLKFYLFDTATLESYQAAALPAPSRQHIVSLTMNCFSQEVDRYGLDVTDPEIPRQRYENLKDLEASGKEFRFVEFTNNGAVSELVIIDQIEYHSFSRPAIDDDFGGYLTIKLRATES